MILLLGYGFFLNLGFPQKLKDNVDQQIIMEDPIQVIEDRLSLQHELESFRTETGIIPAVITLTDESWMQNNENLSNTALQLYLNHFTDESHWLIVYSQPE